MEQKDLTAKIIGCAYEVYNTIGSGFLESVYEKCLLIELGKNELKAKAQVPIRIHYKGELAGNFIADVLVEDEIILELKSVRHLDIIHEVQLVNYLNATRKNVGLLINFGPKKVDIKRKVRNLGWK